MSSFTALFGMLLLASGVLAWQALRAMHERALVIATRSCREANLQLLDATVTLQRVRVARAEGSLGWQLDYSFDISADGQQRGQGRLRFHRGALLWIEMPRGDHSRDLWVVPSNRDD
ncbi:MAG: DUF3301 domain-containing protein [Rhodanobacteraceae bacterium]|nr:DUF3301 domain-containing protein [Rhodanobacteraceae bacterium]